MNEFLVTINQWMSGATALGAAGCFLWGMVSVLLSPCHMASIPLIVGYVAGQQQGVRPRGGVVYAAAFTVGLFITIALVGVTCALLGRMLGDIGAWWTIPVGGLLVWVSLGMLGVEACAMPGGLMHRFRFRGLGGAFVLGLSYGVLSGSCTFGFIAPILAVITLQQKVAAGALFIVLFGIGHCLPIAVAGSSAALVRQLLENGRFRRAGEWFRRAAGLAVFGLGIYFMLRPLWRGLS